jgi:[acyl-carrier-protein] S-malonyltransferase
MAPARERLRPLLEETRFSDASVPIVTNVDARAETRGSALRDAIARQVDAAVRWVESVRALAGEGVDRGLEIGPGNVLAGLARRIDRTIAVESYGGPE